MFQIGQKVVCIDGTFSDEIKAIYTQLPIKNKVYVVRNIRNGVDADTLLMDMRRKAEPSLLVIGLTNPTNNVGIEAGFLCSRFRSLEEIKSSVEATNEKENDVYV
jgi:hypothetical protein